MRIAISGKSGCGNTTVCKMLSDKLGIPLVNYTFRQMAEEYGMDFWDFCALAEKDDSIDINLDRKMVEMAMSTPDSILGSRLAIWNMKDADIKVYLKASDEERARRITKREGGTFETQLEKTRSRDANDSARYRRIYNIDNNDVSLADIVIDTDLKTPEEIVDIIISSLYKK